MKLINTYTGSYPVVFHAPGSSRKHDFWLDMVARMEHLGKVDFCEDFEIITWSSYDYPTLLEKCCALLGVPITVLRPEGEWNNVMKINLLVDYLPRCKAKYIIGLDADDVMITESPDVIVKRYKEAFPNAKLVYNGGYQRWPKRHCPPTRACDDFEKMQFNGSRSRHLNAGAWIGEREYVLDFYKQVQGVEREKLFHTIYRYMEQPSVRACAFPTRYPELTVDTDSVIFQHMLMGVTDLAYTADYQDMPADKKLVYYDLGAFDGRTTLNFIMAHNPARVFSFEPVMCHLETDYWRTIKSRYGSTCQIVDSAAWITDCNIPFYIDAGNKKSQSCTGVEAKQTVDTIDREHPVMVQAISFNNWFKGRHKPNHYTVVKMDIEGAEYDVLGQMIANDTLSKVDELRIEFHGNKMVGDYTQAEESIREYCSEHKVNLIEMDH